MAKKENTLSSQVVLCDILTNFASMGTIINLQQLGLLQHFVTEFTNFSDDYIFIRLTEENAPKDYTRRPNLGELPQGGPIRIDGMAWMLCLSGGMNLETNLTPCRLTANSMAVIEPGAIIEVKSMDWENLDCYMLFVSNSFLQDVNFDPNALGVLPHMSDREVADHTMRLSESEMSIIKDYFSLLSRNTGSNSRNNVLNKSIARCLIAALNYQMLKFYTDRITPYEEEHSGLRSRRSSYVQEFMRLVHKHHRTERSVAFYASKLFISPKYLSLLIKEHTGHSASEVIDRFVILEAKNLLRFSGKNIQQVSYELNFPNQSSFGKYFKHNTGMSPSEYQRS